jgi:DNA-directed RNA polymerase specialized sigma24 family protein
MNPTSPAPLPLTRTHTSWTLVDRLREQGAEAADALNELSQFLYRPVLGVVRAMIDDPDEAEDVCQRFFADVILWRGLIERADRDKGRLRTVVRAAAQNFVRDHWRRRKVRAVVDGSAAPFSDGQIPPLQNSESFDAFDREWFDQICSEACRRCEEHYVASGRSGHWLLFERSRLLPAVAQLERPTSLSQIMSEHGFVSHDSARSAINEVSQRLRALVVQVAGQASLSDADRESQVAELGRLGLHV